MAKTLSIDTNRVTLPTRTTSSTTTTDSTSSNTSGVTSGLSLGVSLNIKVNTNNLNAGSTVVAATPIEDKESLEVSRSGGRKLPDLSTITTRTPRISANTEKITYEVFIPGFLYDSQGPVWIDRIDIEEVNGELLYSNRSTVGVKSLSFYKLETLPNYNTGLCFLKILALDEPKVSKETLLLAAEQYSEYLEHPYVVGADSNKFLDIILEDECEFNKINNKQIIHHYLTAYPSISPEFTQNLNGLEHTGLCFLKTTEASKKFIIKYRMYSKLDNNLYMLVYEGLQKYTPIGIQVDGDVDFSYDSNKDVFKLVYDNTGNSSGFSIKINENYTLPVKQVGENKDLLLVKWDEASSTYINKDISPLTQDNLNNNIKIFVYPQWECNNKKKKTSAFDPEYYRLDHAGKNNAIVICGSKPNNVAPADKDDYTKFNDVALANLRDYFNKHYLALGYSGRALLLRGIVSTLLKAGSFSQEVATWYTNNMAASSGNFYLMGQPGVPSSTTFLLYLEEFGKRSEPCGAAKRDETRTFSMAAQFGNGLSDRTYSWGDHYEFQNFYDRRKYFKGGSTSNGRYMYFITHLIMNSVGFGDTIGSESYRTIKLQKTYSYNFIKDYKIISYLYKTNPSVTILNRSNTTGRCVFADYYSDLDVSLGDNYKVKNNKLTISVKQSITGCLDKEATLFEESNKNTSKASIINSNKNILFENPCGEVKVELNKRGDYYFNTAYSASGFMRRVRGVADTTPVRGWYYSPNAKIFYDISDLLKPNESDYSVVTQFAVERQVIDTDENATYTMPLSYNGINLVQTNLKLGSDYLPEKIFTLEADSSDLAEDVSSKLSSSLKNMKEKLKFIDSKNCSGTKALVVENPLLANNVYVLHVNYLRKALSKFGGNITVKVINTDTNAVTTLASNSTEDTFAFYVTKDLSIKLDISVNTGTCSIKPSISSIGLYVLDPKCSERNTLADVEGFTSKTNDINVIKQENVNTFIFMPVAFCYSEFNKSCYDKTYYYIHIPRQAYLKVAAWYEVEFKDGAYGKNVIEIPSSHPYYKYANSDRFKLLRTDNKLQPLRF